MSAPVQSNIESELTPWTLWAKWSPVGRVPNSYHPLLCHLVDVAAAADMLWQQVLPEAWKRRFADAVELSPEAAERWIVLLAGLHDLGKACPGFQLQLQDAGVHTLIAERLSSAGLPAYDVPWVPHGTVSAQELRTLLPQLYGMPRDVAYTIAVALGGHHGLFPSARDLYELPLDAVGRGPWPVARRKYAQWLAQGTGLPVDVHPMKMSHSTAIALAGFVSVADWIGSSEEYFPHAAQEAHTIPTMDIPAYAMRARAQAAVALQRLGWTGWVPPREKATFSMLFPDMQPRPLQREAVELANELQGPAMVAIEAPMGEGKTEAAMYLADAWSATLGQRGIYFALPTQATSEGMFPRIRDFLARRYPDDLVNLQLLHGHAALSATFQELRERGRHLLTPDGIYGGERPHIDYSGARGAVVAAEWFATGKRSLLAPFGVGTVDQALLAALQVMHVFVRLYGLSTKTVIVDEVHAYDTYMSTLLERLMEWLGALGVPVQLLSATLPAQRRTALLGAYARGAGWPEPADTPPVHYPRISWITSTGQGARQVATTTKRNQQVAIRWLSGTIPDAGAPFPLGEQLSQLLAAGGCAAVVCNTVSRAQRVYQALKPYFEGMADDGEPVLDLFHARFLYEERAEREQRALRRFGKNGPRPDRAVLVATQVIEQSLDLDFDVMITDMAPVDLILQRLGRMHRHERIRPVGLRTPMLYILQPEDHAGIPVFDRGSEAVYDSHILLRSWLALRDRQVIAVPEEIEELVETVYRDSACPPNVSEELQVRWEETYAAMESSKAREQQEAKNRYIKPPTFDGDLSHIAERLREEDAPELHPAFQALTRLTELTVNLVCLAGTLDHPLVRPGGTPIDLTDKPTLDTIREVLRRSVTVADRHVVHTLLDLPVPRGWQQSALLRHHRMLIFGENLSAAVGRYRLRLDPELGLLVEA